MNAVFAEGYKAYEDGKNSTSNPYQRASAAWHEWLNGWRSAECDEWAALEIDV